MDVFDAVEQATVVDESKSGWSVEEEADLLSQVEDVFAHNDMPGSVNSPADANRWLYVIGKMQGEMDDIIAEGNQVVEETQAFYQKKRDSKQRAIDFFAGKIEAYVRATDKNLSLPNGKAGLRRRTKINWASDAELLEYSKQHGIQTKITEKAVKRAIKEFVGDGESTVFTKEEVVDFNINV